MTEEYIDRVTAVLLEVGKIDALGPDDDFYLAGFSSIAALGLLTELETVFDVSIPDDQFIEARNIRQLATIIERLQQKEPV